MKICKLCGDHFSPNRSDQVFCKKTLKINCCECDKEFIEVCGRRATRVTCSRSCNTRFRQLNGELKDSLEKKYGNGIRNPSQIPGHHSQEDRLKLNSNERKIARLKKIYPHLRNVEELVNTSRKDWAMQFFQKNGSKPHVIDLRDYFGLKSVKLKPLEKELFLTSRKSYHEFRFQKALEKFSMIEGEDFFTHKRFLKNGTRAHGLELDFFLPKQMMGFEIQDFATHSRHSDSERSSIKGKFKAGPRYHREKRELAEDFGIFLVEVWEDDLNEDQTLEGIIGLNLLARELNSGEYSAYSHEEADFLKNQFRPLPKDLSTNKLLPWWKRETEQ